MDKYTVDTEPFEEDVVAPWQQIKEDLQEESTKHRTYREGDIINGF